MNTNQTDAPASSRSGMTSGIATVLAHPALWKTAVLQAIRMIPRRWWSRPPYLPVPDRRYVRFRMEAMYGDAGRGIEPDDLVQYLEWCRSYRSGRR